MGNSNKSTKNQSKPKNPKIYNQVNKKVDNSRSVLNLSDMNVKYNALDNYQSPNKGSGNNQKLYSDVRKSRMNTIEPSSTDFTGTEDVSKNLNSG